MLDWIPQLTSQFGDAVTTDTAGLLIQGVQPSVACAPANESQAAALIRFAAAHKIPVVPCGGETAQARCAPPPAGFLALSLMHLDKLVHHEPGDMVATVQGGMTFDAFEKAIGAQRQSLPIDAMPGATLGGIVAANTHGPRAFGCGTLRDMVLGMTVVNGDGVIRKCGGKVVKNVTGYALDKLYIGSFGTLGLITEVTLKLRPFPAKARGWMVLVPNFDMGVALLRKVAALNLPLEMINLVSPEAWQPDPKFYKPLLSMYACGTKPELDRIAAELRAIVPAELDVGRTSVGDFPPAIKVPLQLKWGRDLGLQGVESDAWIANRAGKPGATLRFGCVPSQLEAAIAVLSRFTNAPMSVNPAGGAVDIAPLNEAEAARIATELEKLNVNFAFENITGVNIPNRWGAPRPEWAIMRQIKSALDPAGIMNPGRFVC